ncbi:MAG: hypothetical protein EAZ89_12120 [Bacteroidetes bacterium]|nr:MAG: hypothetical protein EAZ89_12120 [Bacteroidota bacterium]
MIQPSHIWFLALLCICVASCKPTVPEPLSYPSVSQGRKVEVRQEGERYRLYRDGKPFFIRGAAGYSRLEELAVAGGNTVRTWHSTGLDSLLNKADSLGLSVMLGLEVVPVRRGMDYENPKAVAEQKERIRQDILRYKDHPSILIWVIGNELDLMRDGYLPVWSAVNDLAKMIHEIDPEHPVSIAMPNRPVNTSNVRRYCPEIDILSLNVFSTIAQVPESIRSPELNWNGPYIITEWCNRGYWEMPSTEWSVPVEQTSAEKRAYMQQAYEASVARDTAYCLGACVFYWGHKQERTHTWFSLFLESGERSSRVDLMKYLWTGTWPANRAPDVDSLSLNGWTSGDPIYLKTSDTLRVEVKASDPEGDPLEIQWEIRPEGDYRHIFGGDAEPVPAPLTHLSIVAEGNSARIEGPSQIGAYRVFVYVKDKKGGFGSANVAFFVTHR